MIVSQQTVTSGDAEEFLGLTQPGKEMPRLRERVLIVTPVMPPAPIAGSFIIRNLLSGFAPDEITVATEWTRHNPPEQTHDEFGHRIHYITREWERPRRGRRYVLWMRWAEVPGITRRIAALAREHNCKMILAFFPDERLLLSAWRAAEKLCIRFCSYFHNTYRENRSGWERWIADYLQPRVFRRSDYVFVMSKGMSAAWATHYPGINFEPLTHTYSEPTPEYAPAPAWPRDQIRVGFLGSVNHSNLDALGRFRQLVAEWPELRWNLYSNAAPWFLEKVGLCGERITHISPSDEDLIGELQKNDLLILPHGFTGGLMPIEYETIFPTRTVPLLLAQRPIVAHSPDFSYLNHWLREHRCAEIVATADVQALRQAIKTLRNNPLRQTELIQNGLAAVRQFEAARVVAKLKVMLNSCWDRPIPKS